MLPNLARRSLAIASGDFGSFLSEAANRAAWLRPPFGLGSSLRRRSFEVPCSEGGLEEGFEEGPNARFAKTLKLNRERGGGFCFSVAVTESPYF